MVITSKPDCGKMCTLHACISHAIEIGKKVCVVPPTGFCGMQIQNNVWRNDHHRHCAFQYPVEENALPTINWELSSYDVIIVDEISIIPKVIFKHILRTIPQLPCRPIAYFFSGNDTQLQPILKTNKRIVQVVEHFGIQSTITN